MKYDPPYINRSFLKMKWLPAAALTLAISIPSYAGAKLADVEKIEHKARKETWWSQKLRLTHSSSDNIISRNERYVKMTDDDHRTMGTL